MGVYNIIDFRLLFIVRMILVSQCRQAITRVHRVWRRTNLSAVCSYRAQINNAYLSRTKLSIIKLSHIER